MKSRAAAAMPPPMPPHIREEVVRARARAQGRSLIGSLRIEGMTVSMRHRAAAAVPIDERFVARRLAMAEGVLSHTLERLCDGSLSQASADYATLEVERAASRVRYWRELQR